MKIIKSLSLTQELRQQLDQQGSSLTIGSFDGVHLGHQMLIQQTVELAKRMNSVPTLMTFFPHPRAVLFPNSRLRRIFSMDDLLFEVAKLGIELAVIVPFSRDLSQLSAREFLQTWVKDLLNVKALNVGHDFSFGANREGNTHLLKQLAPEFGFNLKIVEPLSLNSDQKIEVISSRKIREMILGGELKRVNEFLGRPFYIEGVVIQGERRGRILGFPTANLMTQSETLPAVGVYLARAHLDSRVYRAMVNVGVKPTFHEMHEITIEAHLLDFQEDVYGRKMKLEFLQKIRDEKKFKSVEDLVAQLKLDLQYAKNVGNS